MTEEAKIIVHERIEPPLTKGVYGYYDSRQQTIHILDRDLLFQLFLTHEGIHHERRNMMRNKVLDFFMYSEKRFVATVMVGLVVAVLITILERISTLDFIAMKVGLFVFFILIVVGRDREEHFVVEEAERRCA